MAVSIPLSHARILVRLNTFISRVPKKALGAAVGAVVAGLLIAGSQAQALVVTLDGQDWDVTTFTGSYNDNVSKFEKPANGGVMPWWNIPCGISDRCAANFASAVGTSLGLPNENVVFGLPSGPLFAYDTSYSNSPNTQPNKLDYIFNPISEPNYPWRRESWGVLDIGTNGDTVRTWAQVTLVPAAGSANVPGPLPILGLAAAFGFSRKLRKRIKLHTAQQTRS